MNLILEIFLVGIIILVGAIIINIIASYLNIESWFEFIENLREEGLVQGMKDTSIISYLFMFVIYPLLLGLLGYYSVKIILNL